MSDSELELEVEVEDIDIQDELADSERAARGWIHASLLGKLQRLVKYILASSSCREEFGGVSGSKKVQFDHLGVSSELIEVAILRGG